MDKKRSNSFKAGGLYIALIICMFMIGVWGYMASLNKVEDLTDDVSISEIIAENDQNVQRAPKPTETPAPTKSPALPKESIEPTKAPTKTPKATTTPEAPKKTPKATTTPEAPKKTEKPKGTSAESVTTLAKKDTGKMIMPVNGKIIKEFSHEALVYSKTMDDWRTHSGIDIAAPKNERVLAALDGKIEKVYTDDMYGITIIIDHGNNLKTVYKNLSTTEMVKEGQKVTQGTPISGVGDTAKAEIAEESHLHFEVLKDGKPVNPKDYL